jgi:hypothetical protein
VKDRLKAAKQTSAGETAGAWNILSRDPRVPYQYLAATLQRTNLFAKSISDTRPFQIVINCNGAFAACLASAVIDHVTANVTVTQFATINLSAQRAQFLTRGNPDWRLQKPSHQQFLQA